MPLDPSIILQQGHPDIVGNFYKSYDAARKRRKEDDAEESSNALAKYVSTKPKGKSLSQHLDEGGYPAQALEYGKQEADIGKDNAGIKKITGEIARQRIEIAGSIAQGLMAEPVLTKEGILQKYDSYAREGIVTPEMYGPMVEEARQLPDDPVALRQWAEGKHQMVMKAAELHGFLQPSANAKLSAQTTMRGQDMANQLGTDRLNVAAYGQASDRAETARYHDMQANNLSDRYELERQKMQGRSSSMKLPAAQQKQLTGVQNTQAAIQEYRDQLKGYSLSDLASPDARAIMDMKYNNMMLQAKEAYNLGVLNGPDYEILQRVVTSPNSLKGVITSNSALDQQAGELDRIMGNIGKVAAGQQGNQQGVDPDLQHTADKYGMTVEELQQFLGQ